jgi:uncharacterized membrane protein
MHGDELVVLLIVIVAGLAALVGGPILSLIAWTRVRRLERNRCVTTPVQAPVSPDTLHRLQIIDDRLKALEDRLEQVEEHAATARVEASVIAVVPRPAVPAIETIAPSSVPPVDETAATETVKSTASPAPWFSERPPAGPTVDLESQIAGHWMNRVGLVAVAIGVSYFLKYAIDNDWIGPTGQVAIGLLIGAGLLGLGPVFLRKGFVYFADGLTGLGAAVLYLSLWAAGSYYHLVSQTVAFVAMIVVTAGILTIAVGRNSQRIAVIAMIGGFMTPALVSTGRDAQVVLFSYLALHNAALLALARTRDWRFLELPALAVTQLYFWGWFDRFYDSTRQLSTLAFATLFFGQFAALPVVRIRRTGTLHAEQQALLIANAGLMLLILHQTLWPQQKWALTFATLLLAAAHLVLARMVPGRESTPRLILAGLALTFVTLAVPIRLSARWITMAWAMEAAVIMWTGSRTGLWYLRAGGFVLFGLVALRLQINPLPADQFLFNVRFGTYLVVSAAVAVSLWFAREDLSRRSDLERSAVAVLAVGLNALMLVALTSEVMLFYEPGRSAADGFDHRLAEGLSISLLWALYATGLVFAGVRWSTQFVRWQGLTLVGFTTLKVFFVDLAMLRGFYRVVSSIALGVVLLVISYVYQRRLTGRASELG